MLITFSDDLTNPFFLLQLQLLMQCRCLGWTFRSRVEYVRCHHGYGFFLYLRAESSFWYWVICLVWLDANARPLETGKDLYSWGLHFSPLCWNCADIWTPCDWLTKLCYHVPLWGICGCTLCSSCFIYLSHDSSSFFWRSEWSPKWVNFRSFPLTQ